MFFNIIYIIQMTNSSLNLCNNCINIYGVEKHNYENCYELKMKQNKLMFCWHCHNTNIKNKTNAIHWHTTKFCPYVCNDNLCHMKNFTHSINDCNQIKNQCEKIDKIKTYANINIQ